MPTPDQLLVLRELDQRQNARDWRGVAALEREARSLAAAVRAAEPGSAAAVYSALGLAHDSLGDFRAAIACHTQCLAIEQEVGDRAGEGGTHGNLGNAHQALGDFRAAIACHTEHLAIAREVGLFLSFHFVTWFLLLLVYVELQSWKKEIRQHIDYDNSLKALRRNERSKNR